MADDLNLQLMTEIPNNTRGKRGNNFAIRHSLIEERNGACEVCGFSCEFCLQVHHIMPIAKGGTNDKSNLALLCANCHAAVEKMKTAYWNRDIFGAYTDDQYAVLVRLSGEPVAVHQQKSLRVAAMVARFRYGIDG
jgi:5-methylcytosine-specific restriction endonuclease McrA